MDYKKIKFVSISEDFDISRGKIYTGYKTVDVVLIQTNSGGYRYKDSKLFLSQKEYRKIRLKNLLETL